MTDDALTDCGDRSCILRDRSNLGGMRTNGGCQHLKMDPPETRRLVRKLAAMLDKARRLPVIPACGHCAWVESNGVSWCGHDDFRGEDIDAETELRVDEMAPPPDWCPLRGTK